MKVPYFDAHCDTLSRMAYLSGTHLERRTGQWDLDKDWDNYVETMNTYGLQTLIERTQATYDAFIHQ